MKNILFFVHGIGRQSAGWARAADGPITTLENAAKLYDCFEPNRPLSDYIDLVEVRYDDIFDQVLKQWQDLAQSLPASPGVPWVKAARDLLAECGDNQNLYADYGGDVLLYCGFKLVARAVRLRVIATIAAEVYKRWMEIVNAGKNVESVLARGEFPKVGVVCHSLGTTVTHDALYQLATANWLAEHSDVESSRLLPVYSPDLSDQQRHDFEQVVAGTRAHPDRPLPVPLEALFLISNTFPLLKQVDGEYLMVKTASSGYHCASFFNVHHKLDPVCNAKPFTMPDRRNGVDIAVEHIHDKNIHGFGHYLSHPLVHGRIFRSMIGEFSRTCFAGARALGTSGDWKGIGGALKLQSQAVQEELLAKLVQIAMPGRGILDYRKVFELLAKV